MDAYDLPDELSALQSQDMSKIGFMQDLIRGVKKVLGGSEQDKPAGGAPTNVPGMASLLKRAKLFLEDGAFDSADEYAEKVLDIDPECAEAYLIKTLIDHELHNETELSASLISMQNDANFAKALRFADEQQKATYIQISESIENNIHTAELEEEYQRALNQYKQAQSEESFASLVKRFAALNDYKDSKELAEQCAAKSVQLRKEREEREARERLRREQEAAEKAAREEQQRLERKRMDELAKIAREKARKRNKKLLAILAVIVLIVMAAGLYVKEVLLPQQEYNKAVELLVSGRVDEAITAFAGMNGWGDSSTQLQNAYFAKGEKQLAAGELSAALAGYEKAGEHAEAKQKHATLAGYMNAVALQEKGSSTQARHAFAALGDFLDSAARHETCCVVDYMTANNLLENRKGASAYTIFLDLGNYSDSAERAAAIEADYASAEALMTAGNYEEAVAIFQRLGDYEESAQRTHDAQLQIAEGVFAAGNYDDAIKQFEALNETKRAQKAKDAKHAYLCSLAEAELAAGNYAEAIKQFEALNETKRAREAKNARDAEYLRIADEALAEQKYGTALEYYLLLPQTDELKAKEYALAQSAYEAGSYGQAVRAYELLGQYELSISRLPVARYAWANHLHTNAYYKEAADQFTLLGAYSDSADRVKQSTYAYGEQLLEAASYDDAKAVFAALGNYEQSATKYKECDYRKATALMAEGNYSEASKLFSTISGYSDSDEQRKECDYLLAEADFAQGAYGRARTKYDALGTYKDSAEKEKISTYKLAGAHYQAGNYEVAQGLYKELNDYEDSATMVKECRLQKALIYQQNGNYAQALTELADLEHGNSAQVRAECNLALGDAAMKQGNTVEAVRYYAQATTLPKAQEKIYAIGKDYAATNQMEKAIEVLWLAGAYEPAQKYLIEIGQVLESNGQTLWACISYIAANAESTMYAAKLLDELTNRDVAQALDAFAVQQDQSLAQWVMYLYGVVLQDAGRYKEAIAAFDATEEQKGNYEDCKERIAACEMAIMDAKYDEAVDLMNLGKYSDAITVFNAILLHKDSLVQMKACETAIRDIKYDAAVVLMNESKYLEAYEAFVSLKGHKDSAVKANAILNEHPQVKYAIAKVGSYVTFGAYEQDANTSNGKEDIEWLVLAKENNRLLVISRYALDCKPYNDKRTDVTWATCTLRKWLNNDFLKAAFSSTEQAMIPTVTVSADKNPDHSNKPGNATKDKLFLLSIPEVNKYFTSDGARRCWPTAYAKKQGAYRSNSSYCLWWLRSLGYYQYCAADVNLLGSVRNFGDSFCDNYGAVRPALWINLEP